MVTYDTTDEDDAKLGVQLGCNGVIQILIEPINVQQENHPVRLLKQAAAYRQNAVIVTLFSLEIQEQPGTCLLLSEKEVVANNFPDSFLQETIINEAKEVFARQGSITKRYGMENNFFTAFIEFIKPEISLVIVGAGNDALPLAALAGILGWQVTVVDGRPAYASLQRFPKAHKVITAKPDDVLSHITIDAQTVFVLMTHNYNYDLALVQRLAGKPVAYIGILGPRKKWERMLEDMQQEGNCPDQQQQFKIYAPVGLDIGAESAEEIALSITAEIKAVLSGRQGNPLRSRKEAIHLSGEVKEVVLPVAFK